MAKIFGLGGPMTGKLGSTVLAIRNGVQLARAYQPVVFNPSTSAQVAQRAKLKLVSQLSAVVAPYIAIPRQGTVSSRNLFTKKNLPLTTYNSSEADITLANVQLTNSNVGMPSVHATRQGDTTTFNLSLWGGLPGFSRVVYVLLPKGADGQLMTGKSVVVETPGANDKFATNAEGYAEETVVLAYGVRDNTENARATFGNMTVPTAETIAQLIVSRHLTEADLTLTMTAGSTVAAGSVSKGGDDDAAEVESAGKFAGKKAGK